MNITPNKTIKILEQYGEYYELPLTIPAEMIEIPPHYRTLKLSYGRRSCYYKIPYTQFYFTELILKKYSYIQTNEPDKFYPIVFITNSKTSNPKEPLAPILQNCKFATIGCICWGKGWIKEELPQNKNELMNAFWNTSFDWPPLLPLDPPGFQVI